MVFVFFILKKIKGPFSLVALCWLFWEFALARSIPPLFYFYVKNKLLWLFKFLLCWSWSVCEMGAANYITSLFPQAGKTGCTCVYLNKNAWWKSSSTKLICWYLKNHDELSFWTLAFSSCSSVIVFQVKGHFLFYMRIFCSTCSLKEKRKRKKKMLICQWICSQLSEL